jgi:hypothetical protein
MPSEQLHDKLMIAVEEARTAGSPVAGRQPLDREQIVQTALRRWSTFPRRNRRVVGDPLERRIEDLAKGLRDQVEQRPTLTGPLMNDYRWLARKLAEVITEAGSSPAESQPDSR